MGRTCKCFAPFVDGVMEYYAAGHTVTETAQHFGVTRHQVNYWASVRRVSNGRTFEQGGRESNLKRSHGLLSIPDNGRKKDKARIRWTDELSRLGFDLLEYNGKDRDLVIKCTTCGNIFSKKLSGDIYRRGVSCPYCTLEAKQAKKKQAEASAQEARLRKIAEKETARKEREAKEQLRLDAIHTCKQCGCDYTIRQYMKSTGSSYRRDSGYCSATCREEHKKLMDKKRRGKHSDKHLERAKKLGLPAERGVTLKKLYKRDGGICQICGMVCDYSGNGLSDLYPSIDHIIPLGRDKEKVGGHTWANVQLAHRICNSVKSAKRGEEWNNGTTKTS